MTIAEDPRGFYRISFRYRPSIVEAIKEIDGRRFDGRTKEWTVPASSRAQLDRFVNHVQRFEPVHFENENDIPKTDEDLVFSLPELKPLDQHHTLKIEPYPYQLEGIQRGLELKRFMNTDEPGLGKAQPLFSHILTPNGYVKMGEVNVGDEIFSRDGSVQHIEEIYPQGIQKTYRVTMSDGSSTHCNMEHLWDVRDQNRRRRGKGWTTKTLGEILDLGLYNKTNSKRESSGRKPSLKWEIPMCDPVQYIEKEQVIPAYTMGVLIGDGYLSGTSINISLPSEKSSIRDRIENELIPSMRLSVSNDYEGVRHHGLVSNTGRNNNEYYQFIKELGLDVNSTCKFIPRIYLQGSIQQRKDLLAGLMDSDGSCIKNRTVFHTTSTRLAYDVQNLVESLGGIAIIHPYDRSSENKGIEYQVNIRTDFCPFSETSYKTDSWKPSKTFRTTRYIASVEYVGDFQQQCIKVSSPDSLYITDDCIVTHNTLQSIATINIADAFPCLVICPASLKINWEREWHKFTDKKAMVLSDSVKESWPFYWQTGLYQVFIVNYESLRKYFVQRIKKKERWTLRDVEFRQTINLFKSVIIDESHRCKSSATQQSKFTKGIAAGKEWIIQLTGTPVVNKPKDLVPQLSILGRMGDFGGYKHFVQRYCNGPNEASNLKELNYQLWTNCMFRREKSKVLKDLPDKIRQTMICDITNRREYMDAENDLIKYLIKYKDASDEKIQRALRGEVMVRINILRQVSARGKIKEVVEFVQDFREQGQKIVLFCSLHEVVDGLKKAFPTAVSVTGRENQEQKQAAIDSFQNNSKTDIIICSIKAAGVGLTLTAASNVAFVEFPWTYADCVQCEDRAHRIGQKDSVTCYYFLGKKTIDEKVYQIIQMKKAIANAVTGSTEEIPENIVDMIANLFNEEKSNEH